MKKVLFCLLLAPCSKLSATVVTLSSAVAPNCVITTGLKPGGGACTDTGSATTNTINSILAGASSSNQVRLIVDGGYGITGVHGPAAGNWEIDCVSGGGFFVVSGSNAPIITDGIAVQPGPGRPPAMGANVAINGCYLNGHRNSGNYPNTNSTSSDPRGALWIPGVFLSNLSNINITNTTVYDSPTYGFLFTNVNGLNISGSSVIARDFVYNTDGFHFSGPASNLTLSGDYCDEGDDCIALNACEG